MPLRAFVAGTEVLASELSEPDWDALRERVNAEGLPVVLPCCGAEGFLRRNHMGTQHFAHKPGAAACEMQGETLQHLSAKDEIVRACRQNGYAASTEIPGEGWRADVLAWRGQGRIAFEVQWSFLRLDECEYRQQRYAADGVRGCWFFRRPPPSLMRDQRLRAGPRLRAQQELPLFQLVASADHRFSVELNGQLYPLRDFVGLLLHGEIRYCPQAVASEQQRTHVVLFECACPRCGHRSAFFAPERVITADCGLTVAMPGVDQEGLMTDAYVAAGLAAFRQTPEAARLHMGAFKMRDGVLGQGCAYCDRAFSSREILDEFATALKLGEEEWLGRFSVPLPLTSAVRISTPHWCCPGMGGRFCCER